MKARFVIVGSGWRAAYYARIAKALPERFELLAVLCRTQEKADFVARDWGVPATVSEDFCVAVRPDFVVIAVSKGAGQEVALQWVERGCTVLAETPAALDHEGLKRLNALPEEKKSRYLLAEQYHLYPEHDAVCRLLRGGIIGEAHFLSISLAHDYHAVSLIRAFLDLEPDLKCSLLAKTFALPTVETLSRYETCSDGRIADKKRTLALFKFENGKTALYDFDSEQYRSPIRKNLLKIQGVRGEIIGRNVHYLDEDNRPRESEIIVKSRTVERDTDNPNFKQIEEIEKITFEGKVLYEPPFGLCGLSQDETAIARLMQKTADYAAGKGENPYDLKKALDDSRLAILMHE